ncbi:CRISPR type I-E-associated protein CasB/Cse2 [Salinibacter ruber]|jgi:CRISPR type I-E-associated protein CasB/Cse2|uniref:type I-E CRISPR-associated protein Cse2/CasB n=1 Tax=Salinibacter ruber TaxID=146919 RepID=UPI00216775F3|nr:type I-E CRISPR-associated protein Cse2/CasB [Salinibacter ruber]MCS4048038.1 CRISPR type I-E-associated protein CasB/Cse2 [Salinibacter ruber]
MQVNTDTFDRIDEMIHEGLGNGERAAIRRGTIGEPFWRTLAYAGLEDIDDQHVGRWQLLFQLVEKTGHADIELGAALRRAEISQRRVDRMLDARPEQLEDLLPRIASQLESANQPVDWTGAYFLLRDSDQTRIRIARHFYLTEPEDLTEA